VRWKRPDFAGLAKVQEITRTTLRKEFTLLSTAQNHQLCYSKSWRRFRIYRNQIQRHHTENVRAQRWRNRLGHKSATTCQNISGGFEDSVSSQFLAHPTNHHKLRSPVIPPSTIHVSAFAHKFETDEEMNQKFIEFLRYLMHPDAHFTEEELIPVSTAVFRS
jgi:hypothetical protein